jgi:2-haloacid dehalogenase
MTKPRAFLFDVFGTLVDWRSSITQAVRQQFAAKSITVDPGEFAVAWRNEYDPSMAPIRDGSRGYTNLDILHRENLDRVLAAFGVTGFSQDERADLASAWERLDPWPDTVKGLHAIRAHGLIAPCSNGSIALMAHLARYAQLPWDCILGAEIARNYKPHPDTYLKSCAAFQLPPEQVMMIAAHNADLHAAKAAGLQTGFIPRPNEHADPAKRELAPTDAWTVIGRDLLDLSARL